MLAILVTKNSSWEEFKKKKKNNNNLAGDQTKYLYFHNWNTSAVAVGHYILCGLASRSQLEAWHNIFPLDYDIASLTSIKFPHKVTRS